jgi:hypothetical protein
MNVTAMVSATQTLGAAHAMTCGMVNPAKRRIALSSMAVRAIIRVPVDKQTRLMTILALVSATGHILALIVARSTALPQHLTPISPGMVCIGSKSAMGTVHATTTLAVATVISAMVASTAQ